MVALIQKKGLRDFDWLLAFMAIGIVVFGTIQIRHAQPTEGYWVKQLIGLGIAIVAMLAVAFNDYRKLLNLAPAFYIFGLILLVIVLIPGRRFENQWSASLDSRAGNRTVSAFGICEGHDGDDAGSIFWPASQRSAHVERDCNRRSDPGPTHVH